MSIDKWPYNVIYLIHLNYIFCYVHLSADIVVWGSSVELLDILPLLSWQKIWTTAPKAPFSTLAPPTHHEMVYYTL